MHCSSWSDLVGFLKAQGRYIEPDYYDDYESYGGSSGESGVGLLLLAMVVLMGYGFWLMRIENNQLATVLFWSTLGGLILVGIYVGLALALIVGALIGTGMLFSVSN
jgi:hypothetical protein